MTGMRRGELLGLRWLDVDLDGARLSIRQNLTLAGGRVTTGTPKTKTGVRVLALDEQTVAALRSWRRHQREERLALGAGWQDTGFVFTSPTGESIHPRAVSRWFTLLSKRAGLPIIRFHDYADLRVMPISA